MLSGSFTVKKHLIWV